MKDVMKALEGLQKAVQAIEGEFHVDISVKGEDFERELLRIDRIIDERLAPWKTNPLVQEFIPGIKQDILQVILSKRDEFLQGE